MLLEVTTKVSRLPSHKKHPRKVFFGLMQKPILLLKEYRKGNFIFLKKASDTEFWKTNN